MTQGAVNPHQCVKCGAPVGTSGGRCPFCGTEQPKIRSTEPTNAAAVGLSDVNRARMGRPPIHAKKKSQTGLILGIVAGFGALAVIGVGVGVFLMFRGAAPAPVTSASAPPPPPVPSQTMGGIAVPDPAHVDPTDLFKTLRPTVKAWEAEAKLLDIHVLRAKKGLVNLTDGGEVVYRYVSEKRDPRAPKGKDVAKERFQITLRQGAPPPEHGPGVAADHGVPEPNCVWSAAHRAAVKSGLSPDEPMEARYAWSAKGNEAVWTFTGGGGTREINGNSCAIQGQ